MNKEIKALRITASLFLLALIATVTVAVKFGVVVALASIAALAILVVGSCLALWAFLLVYQRVLEWLEGW